MSRERFEEREVRYHSRRPRERSVDIYEERDRDRHGVETRERFEERETRYSSPPSHSRRPRERSVDIYEERERIGPRGGYEEDRYERREYHDDEPRYARERPSERERAQNVMIEERETYYSSPRAGPPPPRPEFLRRRSSLESYDRRPLTKFVERETYGPPASSYSDEPRPPPLTPIRRGPPPRRYEEREYEDIAVAEPDFYGDEEFRGYPERIREREIIRRRRRSGSRGSVSSRSESIVSESVKSEFPKKGKTRMPSRLVSKKAILDLGYTFEEEGNVVIIQKALGRENIDEVIKLSEDYKASEAREPEVVIHETTHEVITSPPPPPAPEPRSLEVVDTKIVETRSVSPSPGHHHHRHSHSHSGHHKNPIIIEAGRPREEYSDSLMVGPLALARPRSHSRHESREIRAEIAVLEAERARRHAHYSGRSSETDLVVYGRDSYGGVAEEITLVRREKEPELGTVRIEKDKKGRMSISVPKYVR